MSEWKEVTLQDVVSILGDGLHGTPIYNDKGEYYFINGNNLSDGKIIIKENTKRASEEEYEKYKKDLNDRTILVSINGTLGNIALYNNEKCFLGKSACYFNVLDSVDKQFIKYVITDKKFQDYINVFAHGTTIKNVSLKTMREYPFLLPPLPEQRAISSMLSSLDDKIDLLHRQNKTLEAMAETLFRKWFVEKEFDDTISQLITVQNGYAFKSKDFGIGGENIIIKIKNISDGVIDIINADCVYDHIVNNIQNFFKIESGDVLIAMTGAEIGKLGIVPKNEKSLWLNQRVGMLKEKYRGSKYLAYLQLKSEFGQDYINNTATGSAQPNISGTAIEKCEFPTLDKKQIIEYSKNLSDYYEKVIYNLGQILTLEKLRDTLLPKLMGGEVRVKFD